MAAPAVLRRVTGRLDHLVGGPARRHVIVVFAFVLALDSADKATIGANATQLQAGLSIDKTDIGLLLAISSLIGAVSTIPAGVWVDRVNRTRLLAGAIVLWAIAMALSGVATDFLFLLLTRVLLGAVTAVSGPAVASMIGDYFPEAERGRIWGYVLSGELIGAGFGFLIAGQFANVSWRAPFLVLVVPTALVWWLVRRLPEPERGGASRMPPGAVQIGETEGDRGNAGGVEPEPEVALAHDIVRDQKFEPRESAVLTEDPTEMPLRPAIRHVLLVRTNVVLIVASALGYFYFSGLRGFAIEFAKDHYRVSQSVATSLTLLVGVGALGGVLAGGRLADRLLRGGRVTARVDVPGVAVLAAGLLFVPALITRTLWLAVLLLVAAAVFLGATNPPLDAARLDIIHPRLWGRAEAVRTALRDCADAAAPLVFGVLSTAVFAGDSGLEFTFLIFLSVLFAAAVILLVYGRRNYPQDVAAAARSLELTS